MTTSPKHRWFRFSLRAMFVAVTLVGIAMGWLVWQMQIVNERKAVLAEIQQLGTPPTFGPLILFDFEFPIDDPDGDDWEYARVSRVRRMLGDNGIVSMELPPTLAVSLIERLEKAFPESNLMIWSATPNGATARRSSLYAPSRWPNTGTVFKTGLIEK